MIDYNKAAILAAETLVRYGVSHSPVSPLPILERMSNVITISFAEMGDITGTQHSEMTPLFGKSRDAITSVHIRNGQPVYMVAYNSVLPFNLVQRALAREMAHIVLRHETNSEENELEAMCFEHHLLCPRPLIHTIQATGTRLTTEMLANLTGVFGQSLISIRRLPGTDVPPGLNRFVRDQFMPFFLNVFDYYRTVMPADGSALADLGSYMDGYKE